MQFRIGIGYDVHRLTVGRKLIIGGVDIPYEHGLLGHSDADVLIHAVMDAMLGAMCLGDIGQHFPDSDVSYRDISSMKMLNEVKELMHQNRYHIENIDTVIIAQKPKLTPYFHTMQSNIASTLEIPCSCVNLKATTEEGMGFTGEGLGIAAKAICLMCRD